MEYALEKIKDNEENKMVTKYKTQMMNNKENKSVPKSKLQMMNKIKKQVHIQKAMK